jgi:hypothetical protein
MKRFLQAVLPILVLVGLVGGVTFVRQYLSNSRTTTPTVPPNAGAVPDWEDDDEKETEETIEWPLNTTGHKDFAFRNTQDREVAVRLRYLSCGCASTQVGILTAGKPADAQRWAVAQALESGLRAPGDWPLLLGPLLTAEQLAGQIRWQGLAVGEGLTVPAAGADGPVRWWLRVSWRADKVATERIAAEVELQAGPAGPTAVQRRQVRVAFVPPLRTYPDRIDLGEWPGAGSLQMPAFWCWSAAQDDFALAAAGAPGLTFTCTRLTPEECRNLEQTVRQKYPLTRVRGGYRVSVQPSAGSRRLLDLGPLEGTVELTSDALTGPLRLPLAGLVRGDLTVGSQDEPDRISLGRFPAARGVRRLVALTTARPDLDLQVESRSPDYLQASLAETAPVGGQKRWELTVEVAPDRAVGTLPAGSAIYLTVRGDSARRLRIPVSGQAYR